MFGEGFASAEASFFSRDGKETKRSPGDTTQQVMLEASTCSRHPPEPPWKSAALRLSGIAKIAKLTATRHRGQKSVSFYGSNMIRPPRLAAKTAAVSIHVNWPAGAANTDDFKKIFFSARCSFVPRPARRRKSLPCARVGVIQSADWMTEGL